MSLSLRNIADIITSAAGWKKAEPEADGSFRFSLEGGLEFTLSTPDGQTMFLAAEVGSLRGDDTPEAMNKIRRMASLAVGAMKKRPSVLSLKDGSFELYREFSAARTGGQDIQSIASGFLNDASWWKRQCASPAPAPGPFGMNAGFVFMDGIN